MWAAANPIELEQARAAGNARTVRGIKIETRTLKFGN